MEVCVHQFSDVNSPEEVSEVELKPFPDRLNAIPPRIASSSVPGVSTNSYVEDNKLWRKHIMAYKKINKHLYTGRYCDIMDMNAGLGSFAAAVEPPKSWVMNVVPTVAEKSSLGVICDRGLIGIYHDCSLNSGVKLSPLTQGHMILYMPMVSSVCTRTGVKLSPLSQGHMILYMPMVSSVCTRTDFPRPGKQFRGRKDETVMGETH